MKRLSLALVAGMVAAVVTAGCADEDVSPPGTGDNIDEEVAGPVFDEKRIYAALSDDGATLEIDLGNPGASIIDGTFSVVLRDLKGNALGQASAPFSYGANGTRLAVPLDGLPHGLSQADLVEYVLHYDVVWTGGASRGRRSLYDAVPKLEVLLVTESEVEVERGGHFTLFVLDPATGKPIVGADVNVKLETEDGGSELNETAVAELKTDANGNANGAIDVPEGSKGAGTLKVTVTRDGAVDASEIAVQIVRDQKILMTTDKPMYQPGQTIHLRALALHAGDKRPEAKQELIFEIEDSKGNKLAKELRTTDEFGIAHAEIKLAKELNMGKWTLRAILGETITEKNVTVDRYTLPKFKTTVSLDEVWYAPGQSVKVSGEAKYFFGKPVAGGEVKVVASTFDIDFTPFADLTTTTNDEGLFSVDLNVPSHVVGLALEQGKGALKIDVTVTDLAGQTQSTTRSAPVAEGGITVALVPESGTLAAGLANEVFVVTSDPMGNPLAADVTITHEGTELAALTTSEAGLAKFTLTPAGKSTELEVIATAGEESVTAKRTLTAGEDTAAILLRTDQSVYAVGDTVNVSVLVGEARDRVYLDVVHRGRTVTMQAIEVADGKAGYAFDLDPSVEGDLLLSIFYITDKGTLVRDQKVLFVQAANELTINMSATKDSYLPGENATLNIEVADLDGKGVPSAVGVQIVDEAVFALQEVQPGLLKVFFELARELAEPQVNIVNHAYSATGVVQEDMPASSPVLQDRARVAFASLSDVAVHSVQHDSYKTTVAEMLVVLQPYVDSEKERLTGDLRTMADAGVLTWENVELLLAAELVGQRDLWNRPYDVQIDSEAQNVSVVSSGPDERMGTLDDMVISMTYWEFVYGHQMMPGGGGGDWDEDGPRDMAAMADGEAPPMAPEANEKSGGGSDIKVRSYFPETLFVHPAIITDADGKASINVDMADSITQWRMTGLASSAGGLLGSGTAGITVFQDFFVDINFPVSITRNDQFSVPVALYNYLDEVQVVNLTVEAAEWVEVTGGSSQTVTLQPGQVTGLSFDIRALNVGVHGLTITAQGNAMSDAVKRTVDVRPDGKAFETTASARFPSDQDGTAPSVTIKKKFNVPEGNIDDSQKLVVKVYPGFLSQVVEGMDSMLRLPGG